MAMVAGITASANYGDEVRRPDVAEVVNSDPELQVDTNQVYFYMPDAWRNDLNDSYDGSDLASCTAGIYWWEKSYNCNDYCTAYANAWPGYVIKKTDETDKNVFVADVPADVTTIIFNNTVDGGEDKESPNYVKAIQTENVNTEGYDPGKDPYGFYPEGTVTDDESTWNFDGMIYVCNPKAIEVNPFSGKETYKGCWFYYYGEGKYGIQKTLAEAEAAGAVYQNGEFPPYGLQVDDKASVKVGETTEVTPNDSTAKASGYDESIISVAQDETTGVATITGLKEGTTTITFTVDKDGEVETAECVVTVSAPVTSVSVKAAKTSIKIGATTTVTATVENAVGATTFKSNNTKIATVDKNGKVKGVKAGSAKITATNNGKSATVTIKVTKKDNTAKFSVKKSVTVKLAKVKKAAQKVAAVTVKSAKGKVTYAKASGKFAVDKKTGKITVKKGTKKGTYAVKIKVKVAGDATYASATKTLSTKIVVK